jgi:hypothetical protein
MVSGTKPPQPVGSDPSSSAVPIATAGLQLGYVWQKDSRNLYPILGVTGAAHYGSGTFSNDPTVITAAATTSLASASSWALVLRKDGSLTEMEFPASSATTLAAGVALDASLTFSPSGLSAAVVSPSASAAMIISGLPSKAQVSTVTLPSGFAPANVAISDKGTLLVGVNRPGTAGVQLGLLSETHTYGAIGSVQAWGGAAFLPGSATDAAVVADGGSGQVTYFANLSGASPAVASLPATGLLQKPVAVALSPDSKWAFVADASKSQVVRMSLASSGPAPSAIACACIPQQLVPLTPDGIYSITGNRAGQPDWILDARTSTPRTFFVPALPTTPQSQTAAVASITPSDKAAQ